MSALTSVAELRARLRWGDVVEETPVAGWRVFAVRPVVEGLPRIEFVFDDGVTFLQQLGFGPWHGHFEKWPDNERRNVQRAVAMARTLVCGAYCVVAYRGVGGRDGYLGSGVSRRGEMPRTLPAGFEWLERVTFNAPPERVAVDLGRYHRTKRGDYIEHGWRRELKERLSGAGIDVSVYD